MHYLNPHLALLFDLLDIIIFYCTGWACPVFVSTGLIGRLHENQSAHNTPINEIIITMINENKTMYTYIPTYIRVMKIYVLCFNPIAFPICE